MHPGIWLRRVVLGASLGVALLSPSTARSAQRSSAVAGAEAAILQALAGDPRTAGYAFGVSRRAGALVLSGRVGSKLVHDVAIRIAMDVTPALQDDLVIDTAATPPPAVTSVVTTRPAALAVPGAWPNQPPTYTTRSLGGVPYTYPSPLFGVIDEPFLGFEPPVISYPPYWPELTALRRAEAAPLTQAAVVRPAPAAPPNEPREAETPRPAIEMTVDADGVATLKGRVPTESMKRQVRERIGSQPGVTRVIDELIVAPASEPADGPRLVPPPPAPQPPEPAGRPSAAPAPVLSPRGENAPGARFQVSGPDPAVVQRLQRGLARRVLAPLPDLSIDLRDGVAQLTGSVPSIAEAMQVYRIVEQTPGVRRIEDRLRFAVPAPDAPNPLRDWQPSADVEAYLRAQLTRQLADSAHIERVQLDGDRLTVAAILADPSDRERLEATLRTMPILRGFNVRAELRAD